MRKVVYLVAATLDGQIARADGSFDFFASEGPHVTDYLAELHTFDDVIMGRATYEVGLRDGVIDPYPWMRTHVFSRTLPASEHPNVRIVAGDAATYVAALKVQPGRPVYLCGGAQLAASLFRARLVDEVAVKLNPVLLGPGLPLVHRTDHPVTLELFSVKTYENGVLLIRYRPV